MTDIVVKRDMPEKSWNFPRSRAVDEMRRRYLGNQDSEAKGHTGLIL